MPLVLALLGGAACGDDGSPADGGDGGDGGDAGDGAGATTYFACPGDPGCAGEVPAAFEVGVAQRSINPTIVETMTLDVDDDGDYERREGDEFDDVDGDTVFDGVWLAGFGQPRPANDIHDDIETRVLAIRSGEKLLVVVTADLIGLFYDEVEALRAATADLGIDYLLVACAHNHEAPDPIGIWGLDEVTSGVDPAYLAYVEAQMEAAVREAVGGLRAARVRYGRTVPGESATKGVANVVSDTRDPVILNDQLTVLVFEDAADSSVLATLVNWTAHAEFTGDRNNSITADYPHALRLGIEEGVSEGTTNVPGVGGMAIFTNGAVGGQVGPGRVALTALDGTEYGTDVESIGKAQAAGRVLAVGALRAIAEATPAEDAIDLQWVRARVELVVENYAYHAMIVTSVFDRDAHGYDPLRPLEEGNYPRIWTEVSWIKLGRAQAYTAGGEPCPELFLGGYDGSHTPAAWPLIDAAAEHPPELSLAPGPPYLFDRLEGAEYPMAWGLTNDMLGYFIPAYDFVLDDMAPYVDEAYGYYYEETNSIGPSGWPTIERTFGEILDRRPGR